MTKKVKARIKARPGKKEPTSGIDVIEITDTVTGNKVVEITDNNKVNDSKENYPNHDAYIKGSFFWFGGAVFGVTIGVFLRFFWLTLKPFHHDEGVNGLFMMSLFRDGTYKYDPANYHGPTLYYFALAAANLFGLNDFAMRFVTAFCGVLMIVLVFSLRRYLGTVGTLTAALLIALSPGLVFISRYFIHEIPFLFFTFAAVSCAVKFIEGEKPRIWAIVSTAILVLICWMPLVGNTSGSVGKESGLYQTVWYVVFLTGILAATIATRWLISWNNGMLIYPLLTSASTALAFATKETAFISFGTMLIALGVIWFWMRFAGNNEIKMRRRLLLVLQVGVVLFFVIRSKELVDILNWFGSAFFVNADGKEQPLVLIAIIGLLLFGIAVWLAYFFNSERGDLSRTNINEPPIFNYQTLIERIGKSGNLTIFLITVSVAFLFVGIVFFSSFFTYPGGIPAAFEAYNIWTKTGTNVHTQSGLLGYVKWAFGAEAPIIILGALGALIAFWKAQHRFAMFAALWAFGLFAAYSIIPYKTPWLAINFVLPMALIAGYGINELAASHRTFYRYAAVILLVSAFSISLYQTIELSFFRFDDDSRPYIYVHTKRDFTELVRRIDEIADYAETDYHTKITITSKEYFPLPWTLRNYKKAVFHGAVAEVPDTEIIIGSVSQATELEQKYHTTHTQAGTYTLRPGVDLVLYVRNDLTAR